MIRLVFCDKMYHNCFNKTCFRKSLTIKDSSSYRLCFEYFSQFKIDSEMYAYLAAVLKEVDVSKQVKLPIWKLFWSK